MTVYCKGQPGELPEILDFINMVFSMHRVPHNFRTLLPNGATIWLKKTARYALSSASFPSSWSTAAIPLPVPPWAASRFILTAGGKAI